MLTLFAVGFYIGLVILTIAWENLLGMHGEDKGKATNPLTKTNVSNTKNSSNFPKFVFM